MQHTVLAITDWMNLSFIFDIFKEVKTRFTRYRIYRETVKSLSKLTDKELQDLGISRWDIDAIAMEAYYDNR